MCHIQEENGFTLVGSCQAIGSCVQKTPLFPSHHSSEEREYRDLEQIGTVCCSDQYCNDPYQFRFFSSSSKNFSQSFFSLTLLALLMAKTFFY